VQQLSTLIREVYWALATVGYKSAGSAKAEPAAEANKSVFADHIVCLDCGQSFKMLKRHIRTARRVSGEMESAGVVSDGRS
jgi:predicted transcriptional regulator